MWFVVVFCAYVSVHSLDRFVSPDGVALLWLPNAVLATALLKFRRRDWPYVCAAGVLAEVVGDVMLGGIAPHLGFYLGVVNATEATLVVLCAALIAGGRYRIGLLTVRGASSLLVASATVPALTGAFGAIGLVWTFDIECFATWRGWWFGDSLGLLVGIPIGLLFRDCARSVALHRPYVTTLLAGGAAALGWILSVAFAVTGSDLESLQITLATAVLLTLAFGAVGAPAATTLATVFALIVLARPTAGIDHIVRTQAMVIVVFAAIYAIAAAIESSDQAMRQLSRATSDLATANARLDYLCHTDELTGLSNRRALSENFELLWAWCVRESKPIAILMVDIDVFHQYNATYGHIAGDSVLKEVAAVLQGCGRRKTDLIVRYGGEEFLLVLADATPDYAQDIADQIQKALQDLKIEHSASYVAPVLTASIGILTQTVASRRSASDALERCDELLYEAKGAGRNRTVTAHE